MPSQWLVDYAVISRIDNSFAVLKLENEVATEVYYRGSLRGADLRVQDRVALKYSKLGRLNKQAGVPNEFKFVAEEVYQLNQLLNGTGEIDQLDHLYGFISSTENGRIYFALQNATDLKLLTRLQSLKRSGIYKNKLQVYFRAIPQVPEQNCAWRAIEVSKYPLEAFNIRPTSTVPMSAPIAESWVPGVEGIVVDPDRDHVIVWSKEVGRIFFPAECAADKFTGGIMSRTYGMGKWVQLDLVPQDEKLGCAWKAEPGGKLIDTKMQLSKYEDGFDATGLGWIVRLWRDSGIIWNEELGRIHFDQKTKKKNHGQPEEDMAVGKMVQFVAEPDVKVGIKMIGNNLTPRDVQLGRMVGVTAEPDYIKKEIHWRATQLDPDIVPDGTVPIVPPTVSAKYHSELSGGVVLFSEDLGEHIYVTRFDYFMETSSRKFQEEMKILDHFMVQVVPAMKGSRYKYRALFVSPVDMEVAEQFDAAAVSSGSSPSVDLEPVREQVDMQNSIVSCGPPTGRRPGVWSADISYQDQQCIPAYSEASMRERSDKPNEGEVNARRLEEDRRRAALAREEHAAFVRRTCKSILSTNRGSLDECTASTVSSFSLLTLTNHQQPAGPVFQPGLRQVTSQEERMPVEYAQTPTNPNDEELTLIGEEQPIMSRVTTLYNQRPTSVSPFGRSVSNQFNNSLNSSPNSELSEQFVDARTSISPPNPMPHYPTVMNHGQQQPQPFSSQYRASGPIMQPPGPMVPKLRASINVCPQPSARAVSTVMAPPQLPPVVHQHQQHHQRAPVVFPPPVQGDGNSERKDIATQTAPQMEREFLQELLADTSIKNVLLFRPAIMSKILDLKL